MRSLSLIGEEVPVPDPTLSALQRSCSISDTNIKLLCGKDLGERAKSMAMQEGYDLSRERCTTLALEIRVCLDAAHAKCKGSYYESIWLNHFMITLIRHCAASFKAFAPRRRTCL